MSRSTPPSPSSSSLFPQSFLGDANESTPPSATTPPSMTPPSMTPPSFAPSTVPSTVPTFLPSPTLAPTAAASAPRTLYVVFTIADGTYMIAASEVLHLETFSGATKVPGTPPHVLGVVQIRRRVIPLVDVRSRFGLEPLQPAPGEMDGRRVVVVSANQRSVGLLVDTSREVLRVGDEELQPPPEFVAAQAGGFVLAVAQTGSRLLMLIDHFKVIGAIAAPATAA